MKKITDFTNPNLFSTDFYEYENKNQCKYIKRLPIDKLPQYILTGETFINSIAKENAPAYILNELKNNNNRQAVNFVCANMIMVDIDFKSTKQEDQFRNQYKNYNHSISFDKNLSEFMRECSDLAWISARSWSGKGVHLFFYVENIFEGEILGQILNDDLFTANDVHRSNYNAVAKLITDLTGFKLNDKCGLQITQPTLPCREDGAIINEKNLWVKDFKFQINKKFRNNVTREQAIEDNKNLNVDLEELNSALIHFRTPLHYEDVLPILSALNITTDDNIRTMFYNWIKLNYEGKSLKKVLRNYEIFTKYVDNLNFSKYNVPLRLILNRFNIFLNIIKNDKTVDYYNQKYDKIYHFDRYITRLDIEKTGNFVIKAPTGAGKTTQAIRTLNDRGGVNVFICPTNTIADQTYNDYKDKYRLLRAFDGHFDNNLFGEDCIYITNFTSMSTLKGISFDIAVYDECHLLISFSVFNENNENSNKPYDFVNAKQNIYVSATASRYRILNPDATYIKYEDPNYHKKKLKIKNYTSNTKRIQDITNFILANPEKNVMIFHNNKNENNGFVRKLNVALSGKTTYNLVDSANKGEAYNSIVCYNNATNVITTSVLNVGANINNKVDYVFMIDNFTQGPEDIYQFCNRFRTFDPFIYFMRIERKGKDYKYRDAELHVTINHRFNSKLTRLQADLDRINQIDNNISIITHDGEKPANIRAINKIEYSYLEGDMYYINKAMMLNDIIKDIEDDILASPADLDYFLRYFFDVVYVKTEFEEADSNCGYTKKDAKSLFIKYHHSKAEIQRLTGDENDVYTQYKPTIDNYFLRLTKIQAKLKLIENNIEIELTKITGNRDLFRNYFNYISISICNLIKSTSMDLNKLDDVILDDRQKIENLLMKYNRLDEFVAEYQKVSENLMNASKLDITNYKTINRSLKKFGYRFAKKPNGYKARKI